MNKNFCDRCGELIGCSADTFLKDRVRLPETEKPTGVFWFVEISISTQAPRPDVCRYCRDEMIDLAYKSIVENRKEKGTK